MIADTVRPPFADGTAWSQVPTSKVVFDADIFVAQRNPHGLAGPHYQDGIGGVAAVQVERHVSRDQRDLAGAVPKVRGNRPQEDQAAQGQAHQQHAGHTTRRPAPSGGRPLRRVHVVSTHPTINPVTYMTPKPAISPVSTGAVAMVL